MGILDFMGNGGLIIAIVLLAIALASVLVFSIVNLVSNFEESKKVLIGSLAFIVLVVIGFFLTSNTIPQYAIDSKISALQFKLIAEFLNIAIIATVIACAYVLIDIILGFIRN